MSNNKQREVHDGVLKTARKDMLNYLRISPHLIKTLLNQEKVLTRNTSNIVLAKLSDYLAGHAVIIVKNDPPLAIYQMMNKLKANVDVIPFFDDKTLLKVTKYILQLESQTVKSPLDEENIANYKLILNVRNTRVLVVEKDISQGLDFYSVKGDDNKSEDLQWKMSDASKALLLVAYFKERYNKVKPFRMFSLFSQNILGKIHNQDSPSQQLATILSELHYSNDDYVKMSWSECVKEYGELAKEAEDIYISGNHGDSHDDSYKI